MRFYTFKDAPARPGDAVFRESWINKLIGLIVGLAFFALLIGILTYGGVWREGGAGRVMLSIMTIFMALFPLLAGHALLHALGPQNWVIRCRPGGMLIKLRSYLNDHFPEDLEIIVELRPEEIAWVGKTRERRVAPGREGGGVQVEHFTWLDIKPVANDLSELEARLKAERQVKATFKSEEYPVRVIEGGVIRIAWRAKCTWVTPGADKALEAMRGLMRVSVRPEARQINDLFRDPGDRKAREDKILELAESGDTIEAVKLARKLYGFSLSEARQFVDELMGKETTTAPRGR